MALVGTCRQEPHPVSGTFLERSVTAARPRYQGGSGGIDQVEPPLEELLDDREQLRAQTEDTGGHIAFAEDPDGFATRLRAVLRGN